MRIRKENQFGLNFSQDIKNTFYKMQSDNIFSKYAPLNSDLILSASQQWKWILSDDNNENLLFSKNAIEISDKIKIDKFKPSILKIKSNKKYTFLINEDCFYRVCFYDDQIFGLYVYKTLTHIFYDAFKIYPYKDLVFYKDNIPYDYNKKESIKDETFIKFLKLLIFTEYSEIKEVVLKPNEKHGTKREGRYLNESNQKFTLVDSNWNNIVVRKEGFGVVGHFRLQPFGKDKQERKLIYINEYHKNGYIRGAKKNDKK